MDKDTNTRTTQQNLMVNQESSSPLSTNNLQVSGEPKKQTFTPRKISIILLVLILVLLTAAGSLIVFNKSYKKASNKTSQSVTQNASCARSKTYTLKPETKAKIDESNKLMIEAKLLASKTNSNTDPDAPNIFNDIQKSINDARDAVTLEPKNPLTWEQQGTIYEALIGVANDADTFAISSYQQALAIDSHDCPAFMGLGNVYTTNNNYESAIKSYKSVTQFYPNYLDAHTSLATIYQRTNQQSEAKKELDIVKKLSGNSKNTQPNLLQF